jgi:hypothetical protein
MDRALSAIHSWSGSRREIFAADPLAEQDFRVSWQPWSGLHPGVQQQCGLSRSRVNAPLNSFPRDRGEPTPLVSRSLFSQGAVPRPQRQHDVGCAEQGLDPADRTWPPHSAGPTRRDASKNMRQSAGERGSENLTVTTSRGVSKIYTGHRPGLAQNA